MLAKRLTAGDLKEAGEKLGPFVVAPIVARAEHEPLAAEMKALDRRLLKEHTLLHCDTGERITDPDKAWLCGDAEADAAFHAARDAYVAEHYPELPRGHCPALVAGSAVLAAEKELLTQGEFLMPWVSGCFHMQLIERGLDLLCQIGAESAQRLLAEIKQTANK